MMRMVRIFIIIMLLSPYAMSQMKEGKLVTDSLTSTILKENKVGLRLTRTMKIYLPVGYEQSGKSYPVIYYCHSMFGNPNSIFWAAATGVESYLYR